MIYRAILEEAFLNLEMIQVAQYLNDKEINDLRQALLHAEVLDYSSPNNLKRKVGSLVKRFNALDSSLITDLREGDIATTEFITFYSIVKNEKILFDFLNEVIYNNYIKLKKYITKEEIDSFMVEKARQIEEVNNWTEGTKKRMKSKIVEFSIKGGYLKKEKNDYTIIFPSVSKKTVEHIRRIETNELVSMLFLEKGI